MKRNLTEFEKQAIVKFSLLGKEIEQLKKFRKEENKRYLDRTKKGI